MPISSDPVSPASQPKVYRCGSLTYTKPALAILLFWLFWGDVCYTLMESVTGPIMQLKFKALEASNTEIGLILGTIPAILYSILNPVISFKSDRYRGPRGRRIPFILFSLPFLVAGLVGLAYGDRLGLWIYAHLGILGKGVSANHVALWTLGALLVTFTFFNTFVCSTFWYLFNDVVPEHMLSRFMSWFRMLGTLSAAFYSFFIFPYSGTHSTQIFIGAALLYLVGFGMMCYNVKEGDYPPSPPNIDGQTGPFSSIKTYAKETLSIKHYWFQWLGSFIGSISGGMATFSLFFSLAIGLNLQQIGSISGSVSLVVSVLVLGTGWLADRYHPIRVVMAGSIFGMLIVTPANLIWLFWHPVPQVAYWVALALGLGLSAPLQAMFAMGDPPLLMRIFPRERYGQFCATNGLMRAVGGIIGGTLAGCFLDLVGHWVGKERAYFYIPLWSMCFSLPGFFCTWNLFRSWKKHGGDDSYVPPMIEPTTASGAQTPSQLVVD